ncbi:MAG TPA: hypothetical protein VFB72_08275 [Verrucomicrobiae bacterium]|nr:hypothetical protein [Verrucomicrobiae bacterium]
MKSQLLNELDSALHNQAPKVVFPSTLHNSIMRAVRAEARAEKATPVFWPRWVPVSAFACLVVLGLVVAVHESTISTRPVAQYDAFDSAGSVLEIGGNIIREAPDAAISPLEDEMQRMHHDLDRTKDFLIASLP